MQVFQFIATLQHDNGKIRIRTAATSEQAAKYIICAAENCPASAIIHIKKIEKP